MQVIVFLIFGIIVLTLQTSVLTLLPAWIGQPDLVFILVIFLAAKAKAAKGAFLVLFYGLAMDIFSGILLGLYPIIYLMIFALIKFLSHHIVLDENTHQVPLVCLSYLAANCLIFLFFLLFVPDNDLLWFWKDLFMQLLILAMLTLPSFHILDFLYSSFNGKDRKSKTLLHGRTGNRFI